MVKAYDVDQQQLVKEIASQLKAEGKIKMPEWARFVKTGSNKERAPLDKDWWYFRAASILRKVYARGPIGVSKLRTKYGSKKNRGVKPEKFVKSSGKIIRAIFQQLEETGLIKKEEKEQHKGRIIAPKGASILDKAAGKLYKKPVAEKPAVQKKEEEKPEAKEVKPVQEKPATAKPAKAEQPTEKPKEAVQPKQEVKKAEAKNVVTYAEKGMKISQDIKKDDVKPSSQE